MQIIFDVYDKNSDGYVSRNEMKKVMKEVYAENMASTLVNQAFNYFDEDKDNLIDKSEFSQIYSVFEQFQF